MKQFDVVVAGHLCIDLLPRMANLSIDALTQAGRLFEVADLDVSTGGAVSNTGLALNRLGIKVKLMSGVGEDIIGRLIIDFLNQRDPSLTEYVKKVSGVGSSYTVVLSPQRVDRIFLHHPGTNAVFDANSIDYEAVTLSRVVHLGYPPILPKLYEGEGTELIEIYRRLKQREVVTSLDMSLPDVSSPAGSAPWGEMLECVLPYVDVFIPSFEEIVYMLRRSDFDSVGGNVDYLKSSAYVQDIVEELISLGVKVAGVKCGIDGLMVGTAVRQRMNELRVGLELPGSWDSAFVAHPSYQVGVLGTTGAGDSAYAGFLAAMVRGCELEDAVRMACAVGACNVEEADATSGIRDWDATKERMNSGWVTNRSRIVS